MSLEEERLQILKMVEEGKITAEEAAQLLTALNVGEAKEESSPKRSHTGHKKRHVRISVTDGGPSGRTKKVNVNLPVGIVKMVKKMGGKFSHNLHGVDLDEIFEAIEDDIPGKVVDIQEDENGKRVEIFVE